MKFGMIYRHTFPNGCQYYGQTFGDVDSRKGNQYFSGYRNQGLIWDAICEFGTENITTDILYTNIPDYLINDIEAACIKFGNGHFTLGGYNISWGNKTGYSSKHPQSERQRESARVSIPSERKIRMSAIKKWLKNKPGMNARCYKIWDIDNEEYYHEIAVSLREIVNAIGNDAYDPHDLNNLVLTQARMGHFISFKDIATTFLV